MSIKKHFFFLFVTVLFLYCAFATTGYTDTIYAKSTSYADVSNAIFSAHSGDTVMIPAGVATWEKSIEVTKPLSIIGAGANHPAAGTDNTKLIARGSLANGFFDVHGINDTSKLMRISGIYFEMTDWTPYTAISVSNNTPLWNLRIDHNTFNQGNKPITVYGNLRGVIDNNYIYNCNLCIEFAGKRSADKICDGDASWSDPFKAGTENALFIENNKFIDTNSAPNLSLNERIGTFAGGRLVIRYNIFDRSAFTDTTYYFIAIMTHGSAIGYYGRSGCRRGQPLVEIYNNTITGTRIDTSIGLRGGSNLVHNNTARASVMGDAGIRLAEEECWSNSVWSPSRTQWPAEDQVFNSFFWNNTANGRAIRDVYIQADCEKKFIQKDRDYFMHAPQSSGGRELFTGRPGAAGTYPTDGSYRYANTGTMIFSASGVNAYYPYIPYTYPHPLRKDILSK